MRYSKLIIDGAYVEELIRDDSHQTHLIVFELTNDTVDKVDEWTEFFLKYPNWKFRLIIEATEK